MNNSYQAIYDAVRSRISNGDVGSAVSDAARNAFDISHLIQIAQEAINNIDYQLTRPSAVYKPTLSKDGNAWIALYGDNMQVGVVGCGNSPAKAMDEFDKAWWAAIPEKP